MEGKYALNTRDVNLEFASIMSALPAEDYSEANAGKRSGRTSCHLLQPVHRHAIQAFQKSAALLHLTFHELPIREELIWEMTVKYSTPLCD